MQATNHNPPRILLNAQLATFGESATSNYVKALCRYLPSQSLNIFSYKWKRQPYRPQREGGSPTYIEWPVPPRLGEHLFKRLSYLRIGGLGRGFDLLHLPDSTLVNAKTARTVATLHTAGPLLNPDLFEDREVQFVRAWLKSMQKRCDMLIAVSEHLRRFVIEHFQYPQDRVTAIPLGINAKFYPLDPTSDSQQAPTLLYVGRIRPAKNVQAVCAVFLLLKERFPQLRLKLVGRLDVTLSSVYRWLNHCPDAIRRTEIVDFVPSQGDALVTLYRQARVFLYPSYSEGWTSPPLEAMACGVPVVTSNVSSLPETVGEAAITVDPDHHKAMAEAVEVLLLEGETRRDYIQRGLEWASRFTWPGMVKQTLKIYQSLL